MRELRRQDGIALLTALMVTLICLVIVLALMEFLLTGTKASGSRKNYRNSLEASYGGAELVTKELIPRLYGNYSTGIGPLLSMFGGSDVGRINLVVDKASLKTKLAKPTAEWGSLSRTFDPKDAPDLQFQLKSDSSGSNYRVYVKIVDTVPGNSDSSGVDYIDTGAGVTGDGAGMVMKHSPTLYSLEIEGERIGNTEEKALLSVLYAY